MVEKNILIPLLLVAAVTSNSVGHQARLVDTNYYDNAIQSLKQDIEMLKMKNNMLETRIKGGVSYVRWGRTTCGGASDTEQVYSGFMGGSLYTEAGGAADYQCLPPDPQWGPKSNHTFGNTAHMYGTEYEDPGLYGYSTTYEDAPCAVCYAPHHTTHVMIPGRTDCYGGWSRAYVGYLSAGYPGHASASQFICVDEHPEATQGGETRNDDGRMLYGVRTVCGSLPCPPYHNNKQLSCVVCLR